MQAEPGWKLPGFGNEVLPLPRSTLLAVSGAYFSYFAGLGTFLPFITLYLQRGGWSGTYIGLFNGITPLIAILSQPLWGLAGDAAGDARRLFVILMAVCGGGTLLFALPPVSFVFFLLAVWLGLTQAPLNPILDSLAVSSLGPERSRLGQARLWGSVSFAAISLVVGLLFQQTPRIIFPLYALLGLLTAAAASRLPQRAAAATTRTRFNLAGLRQVLSRKFLALMGCIFLLQLGHLTVLGFLSVTMIQKGATSAHVGYAWSFTALVEIPVFLSTRKFLARFGPVRLLSVGGIVTALRIFVFTAAESPWAMVAAQAIDGLAFPLTLVSIILLVDSLVPDQFKTTGQTIFAVAGSALPRFVGGTVGGQLFDLLGHSTLFVLCGIVTLIGACCTALWNHYFHAIRRPISGL